MADTGSTKNCLKVMRDCPQFARFVRETAASRRGAGAESACGSFIKERGEVELMGTIEGDHHEMCFDDMDVTMPIASVRKAVRTGSDLFITVGGGFLRCRTTGRCIRLYELEERVRQKENERAQGFHKQG